MTTAFGRKGRRRSVDRLSAAAWRLLEAGGESCGGQTAEAKEATSTAASASVDA